MTSAAHIKALAEQTARAFAIDPILAAGGGRTRVRRTAGLAFEIESPDGEDAVRRVVETAEAHNPRLYDLSHAIPVARELAVKRPTRANGVRGVVNGKARHGVEGVTIRPARPEDCGDIAMLFLISSDGLAEYIWSQAGAAGESLLETGRRRYAREGVAFSYQNCLVAEEDGRVIAMLHSFVMPPKDQASNDNGESVDPVLQPYAELEDPGSLYVSGVAVTSEHRRRGLGRKLMEQARARAEALGLPRVSLICFEANEAAMQLYRRLGYVEVDRRPVVPHPSLHYGDGDALLLVRGLD